MFSLELRKRVIMKKFKQHIIKNTDFYIFIGLSILFYLIFFHNNWMYMLMDVDESRYVSMSKDMWNTKDFLTLYLNKEFFFEKPPLYFWSECLSFALWGRVTEAVARFPVALYGTLTCFFVYFLGKKVVSRKYGIISSLILATSLEFVILSKFAILDIVLTAFVTFSVGCGVLTLYVKEQNKKFFWWLFYVFSGLAILAKGIPGFVIPFGTMFFIYLYRKNLKELFKPVYLIPGIIIFLSIILPWHIAMIKIHGDAFINEYIIKHHLARFMGSEAIGREHPFYFYLITLLWGFIPWIFSSLAVVIRKLSIRDIKLKNLNETQTFLMYNGISAIFILLFFMSSSTKLITYILPIYPVLSLLVGYIWLNYTEKASYKNVINFTNYLFGGILLLASCLCCFTQFFIPEQINTIISTIKPLVIPLLFITGFSLILLTKKQKYLQVFFTYVIFVTILSAFGTHKIFEIDYAFGQNDLKNFATFAKNNDKAITCFGFNRKYSIIYYSEQSVKFKQDYKIEDIIETLKSSDNVIIIKNKDITDDFNNLKYKVVEKGSRYSLIEGK